MLASVFRIKASKMDDSVALCPLIRSSAFNVDNLNFAFGARLTLVFVLESVVTDFGFALAAATPSGSTRPRLMILQSSAPTAIARHIGAGG